MKTVFVAVSQQYKNPAKRNGLLQIELAIPQAPWDLAKIYNTDGAICIIEYATEIKQATKK
jgi:hypothetical protein